VEVPVTAPEPTSVEEVAARISDEIAAIHLTHERTLLEHDRGEDSIRNVRKQFQETIGPTFTASVEHTTGRRVIGFLSDTHLDPPFSVEIFRPAPAD
jgi:uncharacterized protein YbcI